MPKVFQSVSSIISWSGGSQIRYVGNDNNMPYVEKQGTFYYFARQSQSEPYRLVMESSRNVMAEKE
jgi:hypothetical protein